MLFGGFPGDKYTWIFKDGEWTSLDPAVHPQQRGGHAMAFDPRSNQVVMYGGYPDRGAWLTDTWAWDGTTWSKLRTRRSPHVNHAGFAYDPSFNGLILFGGGFLGDQTTNRTWRWNGEKWHLLSLSASPPERYQAAMSTFERHVLVFGGWNDGDILGDTWIRRRDGWHQRARSSSPPGRRGGSMAWDSLRHEAVLFGGSDHAGVHDDTWVFAHTGDVSSSEES